MGLLPELASFKVFISDQEDEVHSKIFKFTDDPKLFWVITCHSDKDKLKKKNPPCLSVRSGHKRWTAVCVCEFGRIKKHNTSYIYIIILEHQ